jgi:S-phase kinase-associated protein 1
MRRSRDPVIISMTMITLVSEGDARYRISYEAAELSSVIKDELECQENVPEEVVCTSKIRSPVLKLIVSFVKHYVIEPMTPFETPFRTQQIDRMVQPWYVQFINVEREILLELVMAANFLVREGKAS